jgi:hypothetical protein
MSRVAVVLALLALAGSAQAGSPATKQPPTAPASAPRDDSCPARYHEALAAAKRALQRKDRVEALAQLVRARDLLDTCLPTAPPAEVVEAG